MENISLQARVNAIGPILFTVLHNIPNVAVATFLICEIINFSTPKTSSVILLQALLIGMVSLIPVLCTLGIVNIDAAVNTTIEGTGGD